MCEKSSFVSTCFDNIGYTLVALQKCDVPNFDKPLKNKWWSGLN